MDAPILKHFLNFFCHVLTRFGLSWTVLFKVRSITVWLPRLSNQNDLYELAKFCEICNSEKNCKYPIEMWIISILQNKSLYPLHKLAPGRGSVSNLIMLYGLYRVSHSNLCKLIMVLTPILSCKFDWQIIPQKMDF